MRFFNFISQLSMFAVLLGAAAAVDLQAFQGGGCDEGASVYWSNVAPNTCVTIPLSFGVRFFNMPSNAQGQVYYDSHCSHFTQAGGSGTYCLDEHNNMRSANWFYKSSKLRRSGEEQTGEPTTGIQYTDPDGTNKRIIVSPSEFEYVLGLVEAKNWTALEGYPTGKLRTLSLILSMTFL